MKKPMSDRTLAEVKLGSMRARYNMAESFVHVLLLELDRTGRYHGKVVDEAADPRDLVVAIFNGDAEIHRESFFVFPSDELKAKILLIG